MEVDVENYPVTGFGIRAINTPLRLILEGDERRERYEKAYKALTSMENLPFECFCLFILKLALTHILECPSTLQTFEINVRILLRQSNP